MIEPGILKRLSFFEEFSEDMIDRLAQVAELRRYEEGAYLNKRKKAADYFYIILEGEINLEMEGLTGETVKLETIAPGGAIGFSSLIDTKSKRYLSDAKALTPVEILRFSADELTLLFYQNFEMGYLFMKKIAFIAKTRLENRFYPIPRP